MSTQDQTLPALVGIGARLTLTVAHPDHATIVTRAVRAADSSGLVVTADDVSIHVAGDEQALLQYLTDVIAGAAVDGAPVIASLLLSRGCPDVDERTLPAAGATARSGSPRLEPAGVPVRAQWALYPLDDGRGEREADHMRDIYAVIEHARDRGIVQQMLSYVTVLEGDLAEVLETVGAAWITAGRSVQHVATHLTLSANGPAVPAALR